MDHSPDHDFYVESARLLTEADIPFMVGGAFALRVYTGIARNTKDFDLMVKVEDRDRILRLFREAGYRADVTFAHWLAKIHHGEFFIDIIFNSGNGLCPVDDQWFLHAREVELLGASVKVCPPEELLWQKCYIMERERFDGADVAHILRSCGAEMDWPRLVQRFGPDWRVLYSHLILFGFIFPSKRELIPSGILKDLAARLAAEVDAVAPEEKICQGPLLSRAQYLFDIERWGFRDARNDVRNTMGAEDIAAWTSAIERSTLGR